MSGPRLRPGFIERFYKLPQDLAARKDLTPGAKVVFAVIRDRIGRNGKAWPGTRRIGADCGLTQPAVLRAVRELDGAGCLAVEERGNGRAFHYRLPTGTAKEPLAVAKGKEGRNRARTFSGGAQEPCAVPLKNLAQNQTDPLNQTGAAAPLLPSAAQTGAAEPPAAQKPKPPGGKVKTIAQGDGAAGRLVKEWADRIKTRGLIFGNRGQVAGVFKAMLKSGWPEADLLAATARWWGADRPDYGIGLFKARLDGGNTELAARDANAQIAALAEAGSRNLTPEDMAFLGWPAAAGGK